MAVGPLGGVSKAILLSLLCWRILGSWGSWRYPVARPLGGVSQATSKRSGERGGRERDHGAGDIWPSREQETGRERESGSERVDLERSCIMGGRVRKRAEREEGLFETVISAEACL